MLERLIPIQVRMLDNVIDLNALPVREYDHQPQVPRHRPGHVRLAPPAGAAGDPVGVTGCRDLADRLYERINFLTIQASAQLAKEKGSYPMFTGSDWHHGRYFRDRDYTGAAWDSLAREVATHGLRNGWLLAVAPNMSTAQIAGSTASIDPIYSAFYEEKKDSGRWRPGLSLETWPYYEKGAYKVDQFASVRQNARRQRHVDQSISFNLYVPSTIRASTLLELHLSAWREGLKTTTCAPTTSTSANASGAPADRCALVEPSPRSAREEQPSMGSALHPQCT